MMETVETRSTRIADFLAKGSWRFVNYFEIVPPVEWINGRPHPITTNQFTTFEATGEVNGIVMGKNFMHCEYCGTSIMCHFTIENRETKEKVNIGCFCIEKIDGLDKASALIKGYESVKRKIKSDYRRKIHVEQMLQFLDDNMKALSTPRHESCDKAIKDNIEHFWKDAEKTIERFVEGSGDEKGKTTEFKIKRTLWERKEGADARYDRERNYWENFREKFERRNWNAKTMHPEIQKMIDADKLKITVPKLRQLTEAENKELGKEVTRQLNEYAERVGLKK